MAIMKYLDEHGTETVLKKIKNQIWRGTQAEWDALSADEKDKYEQAEIIGLDNNGVVYVADKVESGNMNPVTSNAVAKVTKLNNAKFTPKVTMALSDVHCDIKAGVCIFYLFFNVTNDVAAGTVLYDVPKNIGQPAQANFIVVAGNTYQVAGRLRIAENSKQLYTNEMITAGTTFCGQLVYFTDEEDV